MWVWAQRQLVKRHEAVAQSVFFAFLFVRGVIFARPFVLVT